MSVTAKPDADWREQLLADRAERLAQRPAPLDDGQVRRVCLCEAGGDVFGLPVEEIARVIADARPAPLADADPALLGIVSRSGGFALIYDLSALAGGPAGASAGHIILLRHNRPVIGLKVTRTLSISDIALLTAEEAVNLPSRTGVTSYGRYGDRIVSIIDTNALIEARAHAHTGGP